MYELLGEAAGCRRLATAFYARVPKDPVLRRFFPGKSMKCAIEAFTAFLVEVLGGPGSESQFRWYVGLRDSHSRFRIGQPERAAWMALMARALEDAGVEEPLHSDLLAFFDRASARLVNHPQPSHGQPPEFPEPRGALAPAAKLQETLDEVVAAIRAGAAVRAIRLTFEAEAAGVEGSPLLGLFALMLRSGNAAMAEFVRQRVADDLGLVQERHAGRTLLHEAAAAGDAVTIEFLLGHGADPNALDGGDHPPLYSLANECQSGGGRAVRVLVEAGADVNSHSGVQRCTPLHMAARRDNPDIAEALLECGADPRARAKSGDTPIERALNCRSKAVAALLRERGA